MYLKVSTGVKISTFSEEKWGDQVVDHEIDLYCNLALTCISETMVEP